MKLLFKALAYLVGGGAVIIAGWFIGLAVGEAWHSEDNSLLREALQNRLEANAKNLKPGESFPDLILSPVTSGPAQSLWDLLPKGGVLVLVSPGCEDCVFDLIALEKAAKGLNLSRELVLAVANTETDAPILHEELSSRDIRIRLWIDAEQTLHRSHGVPSTPVFFIIGEDRKLIDMQAGKLKSGEIRLLLKPLDGSAP